MSTAALPHTHRGDAVAAMRRNTLAALARYTSAAHLRAAEVCAAKLLAALPARDGLRRCGVLLAYGGGKDSSHTLAFVRAMQLVHAAKHGDTFRLRVITNRHAAMPAAVMHNIGRAYAALGIFEDPDCEPLLADAHEVKPFRVHEPLPRSLIERNRDDILLTGHRTHGDPRPTFCNACNFSMVSSFGLAAAHGDGVDVLITGDSITEQRAYTVWVTRLAQKYGVQVSGRPGDFAGFLTTLRGLSRAYFTDLHGHEAGDDIDARMVAAELPRSLRFFSIYGDTPYASSDHWELLTEFLGFQFDDVAFSFSESDCANPALMAHLRGLKCERIYGRDYAEGLDEYVRFAIGLMRKKEFPEALIQVMQARYAAGRASEMRSSADALSWELYRLGEVQLVCMLYSPFAEGGRHLERYLGREQPALAARATDIRRLLGTSVMPTPGSADHALARALADLSHLELAQLRVLFASPIQDHEAAGHNLIRDILKRDPHKAVITTRHAAAGPAVTEQLSGR